MLPVGLKIVLISPRGGLTGRFLHCFNEKKITGGYPRKSEKSLRGGLKSRRQTPLTTFSNGIALTATRNCILCQIILFGTFFVDVHLLVNLGINVGFGFSDSKLPIGRGPECGICSVDHDTLDSAQ